ncbi:MAG: hypothetical protein ORN49_06815, partial [Rhodobacteraceae bacterium]|nr:hypothetical protein [Paracoccaceae bacterium]
MNLRPLAFVRLIAPLPLLILASFWRDPLIDLFEHLFTLSFVDRLILILSTAGARLCLCLLLALLAWGGAVLVRRSAWPGLMLIFLFLVWLVAGETLMPTRHGIFYWAVIAAAAMVNSLPAAPLRRALQRPVPRALLGLIFWGAIGFAEALAPRPYL